MTSCLNIAERLFGGFEEIMQLTIVKEDRIEVFNVSHDHSHVFAMRLKLIMI